MAPSICDGDLLLVNRHKRASLRLAGLSCGTERANVSYIESCKWRLMVFFQKEIGPPRQMLSSGLMIMTPLP